MTAPNTPTPELVERLNAAQVLEELDYEWGGKKFVTTNLKDKLNELISTQAATIAKLTAERDAMLRELKAATGHDDGLIAIRHLVLRATQAENYITATEESGK